jgi:8-oxo-dGTP diphosphatase
MPSLPPYLHYRGYGASASTRPAVMLLAGWNTPLWLYALPARWLAWHGFQCHVYAYDSNVFSADAPQTLHRLTAIRDAVVAHVAALKAAGCPDVSVFGFSLGGMLAFMVANHAPAVSRLIGNLVSTGPAEAAWGWDRTRPAFKRQLQANGYTLASLTQLWQPLAPAHNLDNLRSKSLLIYLAKRDQLAPYPHGLQLVELLKARGYYYELSTSPWGHMLAGLLNLMNMPKNLRFLRTPAVSRRRAAAIVIKDHQVLVMWRRKEGREYFTLPGGGIEAGETPEAAAVRELQEETSILAEVVEPALHFVQDGAENNYFLCRYLQGEPQLGDSIEKERMKAGQNLYQPQWLSLDNLPANLYPENVRIWLQEWATKK